MKAQTKSTKNNQHEGHDHEHHDHAEHSHHGHDQHNVKDGQLIHLTETAAKKIKSMMANEEGATALRLSLYPGGCSGFQYGLDFEEKAGPADVVSEDFGVKVLVEKGLEPFLLGTVIDYAESLQESGFKINNPNTKSSCGCGKSSGF